MDKKNKGIFFKHPEPLTPLPLLLPFFMPYAGCKQKCIFCAQDKQTGVKDLSSLDIKKELLRLENFLNEAGQRHRTTNFKDKTLQARDIELAFFGGTFTALPKEEQLAFLSLAKKYKVGSNTNGFLSAIRCSTRPDELSLDWLQELKKAGLDLIELGIQSFEDSVLQAAKRGYLGATARQACQTVKDAQLRLGVQLLPNLPAQSQAMFINDMHLVREIAPEYLRLYPCQVIEGSALATLWQQGAFKIWELPVVVELFSQALLLAWGKNIRVIRMGLAPEPSLDSAILAGARHQALGQMARSKALWRIIKLHFLAHYKTQTVTNPKLYVPKRYQGELLGHKNELFVDFAKLGFTRQNIIFWDSNYFALA